MLIWCCSENIIMNVAGPSFQLNKCFWCLLAWLNELGAGLSLSRPAFRSCLEQVVMLFTYYFFNKLNSCFLLLF